MPDRGDCRPELLLGHCSSRTGRTTPGGFALGHIAPSSIREASVAGRWVSWGGLEREGLKGLVPVETDAFNKALLPSEADSLPSQPRRKDICVSVR